MGRSEIKIGEKTFQPLSLRRTDRIAREVLAGVGKYFGLWYQFRNGEIYSGLETSLFYGKEAHRALKDATRRRWRTTLELQREVYNPRSRMRWSQCMD